VAYLGLTEQFLMAHGADRTSREIAQQPQAWEQTQATLWAQRENIARFLRPLLVVDTLRIILTGAGSSAYIGQCLAPALLRALGKRVEAIATTDLVAGPREYLQREAPTLLVSFARSGASPESLAAIELADQCVDSCHHLIITCNAQGPLYRNALAHPARLAILLPEITHDLGFAMTASFSSMLYAGLAIFRGIERSGSRVELLARSAANLIERHSGSMKSLAERDYQRVVFLGSRGFAGLAAEAALKLLELTDGAVVSVANTPLGFRHGPKTIVNRATLVVLFVSNDPLARQYEMDLLQELQADSAAGGLLAIGSQPPRSAQAVEWLPVPEMSAADDAELMLPFVIVAQMYALHRSLQLGNTPDTPCASGRVSRIVKGVAIYPL
jgi:tagatose-6-phosphate ketose/aldose isomerase